MARTELLEPAPTQGIVDTRVARGTTNGNARGNSEDRRRRREWLVQTYRADMDAWFFPVDRGGRADGPVTYPVPIGAGFPAARCYRCGELLTVDTVTVDRIIPGCLGGTYRRNNIRPACAGCNSETGGRLGNSRRSR